MQLCNEDVSWNYILPESKPLFKIVRDVFLYKFTVSFVFRMELDLQGL